MAPLLQSQQRRRGERAVAGGQSAKFLIIGTAALAVLYLTHQLRRPVDIGGTPQELPGEAVEDVWDEFPVSSDESLDAELAELDHQLEELRKKRAEVDAGSGAGSKPRTSQRSSSDDLPSVPPVTTIGDVRSSWELIVNYAIDHMAGHCGTACEACASTLGREMVKADSLLLRGGQATVLGELKTETDMREEVDSVQRDIGQCTSRLEGDVRVKRERQQQRAKIRGAESMYKREMRETERREQEAVKYELLKQQLQDTLEAEEAEEQHLHDIANPIWLSDTQWAEQSDELCTQKVELLLETKFPPESTHSKAALKFRKEMFNKCIADAKVSRAKLKADARQLQKELRQKKRDSFMPFVNAKHRRHEQLLKYAGIEADAVEELRDIGEEALHVSIRNLGRNSNGGKHAGLGGSKGKGKVPKKELRDGLD